MAKRQRSGAVEPTELEVSEARKAFERLESALKGLSPGELVSPRVDVQRAAAIAFSIAVRDGGAERRAKFVKLAEAGFFEIAALDELRTRALAAWYARAEQVRISSLSSDAKVPEPVLRDAMEMRGRMLRMLGYFFDDDAELGPEIAVIRRGSGYQDLANDLLAMADLYERDTVRAVVTRDPKNYREGDVASARTYAQTIFRALGLAESDDAQRWASNTQRAWTLLLRGYEQTRASRWYWAGFLAPEYARDPKDPNSDDEMGAGSDEDEEEGSGQEQEPKQKKTFAASLGLSVLLPPKTGADRIAVTVRFAEYVPDKRDAEGNGRPRTVWRRVARGPFTVDVPIEERELAKGIPVSDAPLVHLTGQLQPADAPGLARGTRALALFLVNHRQGAKRGEEDADYLFQVQLELAYEAGFVPRPNRSGELAEDEDDRVADLQFRDRHEWAVGHGVAVEVVPEQQGGSHVTRVRTTFLPHSELSRPCAGRAHARAPARARFLHEPAVSSPDEVLSDLGLSDVPLAELRELWRGLEEGRVSLPLAGLGLTSAGVAQRYHAAIIHCLAGLDRIAVRAALDLVLAERVHRPPPRLDLLIEDRTFAEKLAGQWRALVARGLVQRAS